MKVSRTESSHTPKAVSKQKQPLNNKSKRNKDPNDRDNKETFVTQELSQVRKAKEQQRENFLACFWKTVLRMTTRTSFSN